MELRGYQVDAFKEITGWLAAGERDILLESPVGSGKTNTVKAILAAQLAERIRLAVVLVPQVLLEKQWGSEGAWKVGPDTFTLPMAGRVKAADFTPAWLRTAAGVFVMTRQAFTKRAAALDSLRGGSLSGVIVVADEGHHCADTTKGAQALAVARKRGAATLLVSATPWATAGEVGSATTKAHRLPDAEYVTSFEADDPSRPPAEYAIDIVRVGKATSNPKLTIDDSTSARRTKGPASAAEDAHARKICGAMATRWAADGFPCTVMNVPRVFWRDHLHRALARAWKAARGGVPEIVDLIGDEIDPVAHERLKADSEARRWSDVKVHAVLSCARMDEGLDWVPCSHVYNAGIPSVAGLILQRWGRAARGKRLIAGYPEEHAGARTLVFFTPPGKGTDKGWGKQIETAWILAGCLADYQVMRDWIEERKARGERGSLPVPPTSPAIAEWTGRLAAQVAARGGEMAAADARTWLAAQKKPPAPAVIDAVVRRMQAADARHRVVEEVRALGGLKVRADRKADAGPLIEEFEAPLRASVSSIIKLTALDAKALTVRQSGVPPWDHIRHDRVALETFARERAEARGGTWPTNATGRCASLGGWTWGALDWTLRERNSSLGAAMGRVSPNIKNAKDIRKWRDDHGRWPRLTAEDPTERRLARAKHNMRATAPKYLESEGIPLKDSRSEVMRQIQNKPQFTLLADVIALLACHWRATQRTAFLGKESGAVINDALRRPEKGRGIADVPDLCHVTSVAYGNAEIEADCWRFTLTGSTTPDPRPWADLLASGDHKRIERAERVAFLDWKDSRLLGGTRWTDPRVGKGPKCLPAVRRTWTPPALAGKPVKRVFKPKAGK